MKILAFISFITSFVLAYLFMRKSTTERKTKAAYIKSYIKKHPEKNRAKSTKWQNKMIKEGRCRVCGKAQVKTRTGKLSGYCQKHLTGQRKLIREWKKRHYKPVIKK